MALVKLVTNENRSLNPFKGTFLLNFKIKGRNDTTAGKIDGKGNYLFNQYQTMIALDEYLSEFLEDKASKKHLELGGNLKWSLDEDLDHAFLYYKTFFKTLEDDAKLTDLWTDLKISVKKMDDFIESELNTTWSQYTENIQNDMNPQEAMRKLKISFYTFFKELVVKPFFKECLKGLSSWIQLVCNAKGVKFTITSKSNPLGFKFDVFSDDTTAKKEPAQIEAMVENTKELKEKYVEYEKAQLKAKMSQMGAYTTVKQEDGDFIDLYFEKPQDENLKEKVIAKRKQAVLDSMDKVFVDQVLNELPNSGFLTAEHIYNVLKLDKSEDVDNYIERVKLVALKELYYRLEREVTNKKYIINAQQYPDENALRALDQDVWLLRYFHKATSQKDFSFKLSNALEFFLTEKLFTKSYNIDFKPLIQKIKLSKIDSKQKYDQIIDAFINSLLAKGEYTEATLNFFVSEELKKFPVLTFLDVAQKSATKLQEPQLQKSNFPALYEFAKKIGSASDSKTFIGGKKLDSEVKEEQTLQLRQAKSLFSEKFGIVESENGKSAYEVYQQKKFEVDLKSKVLRDAYPSVEGNKLVFKHIKKLQTFEKDANGQLILDENGKPKVAYEKNRDGSFKLDLVGNPIPIYQEVSLNIDPITIERMSDEDVDSLTGLEKEVDLSDDTNPKAQSPFRFAHLVRVKTTTINGITKDIIIKGPFKGFSVEELANTTGKFLGDGQAYSVDENGNAVSIHEFISTEDGDVSVRYDSINEPYITWSKDRFLITLPPARKYAGERNSLKKLKATRSSIEVVQGSGQSSWSYYFQGEDYEAIKACLGSCLMSKKAHDELKKYYAKLLEKDRALKEENLLNYTPEKIGGFKENMEFNNKQQEALAWLDSNDLKGVMALDTGVGKTLVGVTAMQIGSKKKKDAKFLIISSDRLVGNFFGEIDNFLTPEVATNLKSRSEEIGYTEFVKRWEKGVNFKSEYYCMIFDEVNEALTGKASEAISNVKHPRKILLTGSALEKSPADLFRFVSLSTGNPIDPAKEKAFVDKYAVNVGGKFVGIKPEERHLFNTWLKQNAYFANKMDVEYKISQRPKLKAKVEVTKQVNMDEEVATAYSKIAVTIQKELKQMQERYAFLLSDQDIATMPENLQNEKDIAVGALKSKIALLHLFSLNPTKAMKKYAKLEKLPFVEGTTYANPKIDEAVNVGEELIQNSKKVLYFTEDNDVAKETALALSKKISGRLHALCLSNYILFYENGKIVKKSKISKKTNLETYVLRRNASEQPDPTKDFVDMGWAIKAVKKVIVNNDDVATMTCNSSYARGFNLQNFKAVVHLDRDGWDSEEIKQRTARAFRQGQKDEVLEIMVDAVLPPSKVKGDMAKSIDELRGMVHGADQKFFNAIIKESGAIKLSENYDKVEHAVVTDKATKPNLEEFTRAIIPTREVQNQIAEFEKNKKEDPIKHTILDPNRFNHPDAVNLTEQQKLVADLSGFSALLNVSYKGLTQRINVGVDSLTKNMSGSTTSNWLDFFVRYIYGVDGEVKNHHFKTNRCAPDSLGNRALFTQLVAMKKQGMNKLKTTAAGDYSQFNPETGMGYPGAYIGYWVWPKFGYDAIVSINLNPILENSKLYKQALVDKQIATNNLTRLQEPIKPIKPIQVGEYLDVNILRAIVNDTSLNMVSKMEKILDLLQTRTFYTNIVDFLILKNYITIEQIMDKLYFKTWDVAEELEYHNNNRILLNYASKYDNALPLTRGNKKDLSLLLEGYGKYYSYRSDEYVKINNKSRSEETEYQDMVLTWNYFVTPYLTKYPDICNLFNLFSDQNLSLTQQQLDDFLVSYETKIGNEQEIFDKKTAEYNAQMVIYNEQYRLYEEEKQRHESFFNPDAIEIDKKTIMDDLANNVYSASISSKLTTVGWHLMRRFKACYILEASGKVTNRMSILDLYEIVHKGADGKVFKAGEEWWKVIGFDTNMELNIADENSKSYKKLTKYMIEKVKEAGFETLEEYLSSPVDPFDVNSISCWIDFFNNPSFMRFTKEDRKTIVKTYAKELKAVLMKANEAEKEQLLVGIEYLKTSENLSIRVAKQSKKASEEFKTDEDMMYQNALADDHILTAIDEQIANEEKLAKTAKEISVLRGDLKPISNPFKKPKGV